MMNLIKSKMEQTNDCEHAECVDVLNGVSDDTVSGVACVVCDDCYRIWQTI